MSSEICFRDYRATDLEAMLPIGMKLALWRSFRFDRGSMRGGLLKKQNAIVRIAGKG